MNLETNVNLPALPYNILVQILNELPLESIVACAKVDRRLHAIAAHVFKTREREIEIYKYKMPKEIASSNIVLIDKLRFGTTLDVNKLSINRKTLALEENALENSQAVNMVEIEQAMRKTYACVIDNPDANFFRFIAVANTVACLRYQSYFQNKEDFISLGERAFKAL